MPEHYASRPPSSVFIVPRCQFDSLTSSLHALQARCRVGHSPHFTWGRVRFEAAVHSGTTHTATTMASESKSAVERIFFVKKQGDAG
jgi:hypothetical protein